MTTPIFIDLETRSACDLRQRGGWAYAADPSTRLLTLAWIDGQDEHVWLPGSDSVPEAFRALHLPGVTVHTGPSLPAVLPFDRPWVCHNCDTFDALVWRGLGYPDPIEWVDTFPRALALGLPGGLDKIGKLLSLGGKLVDGKKLMLKASKALGVEDADACNVPAGQQVMIAAYNLQDVRIGKGLWDVIEREYRATPTEARVLKAHTAVNDRGVKVDRELLHALIKLDADAKADAVKRIAEATGGRLKDQHDLQSRTTMFAWLDHMGVNLGTSLRKTVVDKWIGENRDSGNVKELEPEQEDEYDGEKLPSDLATVVRVLEWRAAAMRITGGKLKAALECLGDDDHVRGLHVYHAGHTGRWAARRIQTHNLPRPKKGVKVWSLIDLFERTGELDLSAVSAMCDPNDAASALLRSLFILDADADLSQIEARVLAWLAGEKWLMDTYWADEDPYVKMAEVICGPKANWKQPNDNRQIFGKVPVLACGYGGGPKCLAVYAATFGVNMQDHGVSEDECVWAWRRLHSKIAGAEAGEYKGRPYFRGGLWDQYEEAAVLACETGGPVQVGPVTWKREGRNLIAVLPSGRRFVYRDAQVVDEPYFTKTKKTVVFNHPRYGRKKTYGGFFAENITQAVARDVIAYALAETEARGLVGRLHVHDSLGGTVGDRFEEFMSVVSTPPDWLKNFPLDAKGSRLPRWAKDPPPGVKEVTYRNGVLHG